MFHKRRQHTICFAERFERPKKSCRVFLSPKQVQSYKRNGKRLKPARRRWKSTKTFTKKRNNDIKMHCRDIKGYHMDEMEIISLHKRSCNRKAEKVSQPKKASPNQMNLKKYQRALMIQARKNRYLKKSAEKRPLQRPEKKLKRLQT